MQHNSASGTISLSRLKQIRPMLNCKDFISELDELLTRSKGRVGVFMLDLDRFHLVNEIAGHDVGESLLEKVKERLILNAPANCIWANYWGDKFFLAVPSIDDDVKINIITQSILNACRRPWVVESREFFLSIGIGIAMYPKHGISAVELMKNADLALAEAKSAGSNTYQFYKTSFLSKIRKNFKIEETLRRTLDTKRSELFLHYQPKINLRTGQIDSFEALIRWNSKELGALSPDQFIPIAETSGLIIKLGEWVLINACRQIQQWQSLGYHIRISVNLSANQLYDEDLVNFIISTLDYFQINPRQLELEITETMIMLNLELAVIILNKLKDIGVQIAMDDFGTGYSSLTNLKELPIDILKIDKSFIQDMEESKKSKSIVQAIITLGHILGLKVTAEGVETYSQLAIIRQYACDEVQGFYFSRPILPEDAYHMIVNGNVEAGKLRNALAFDSSYL